MSPDTSFILLVSALGLAVMAGLTVLAALTIHGTIRKRGRWGINFGHVHCKHCDEPMPPIRVPANFRQAMWGGWTCPRCGLEVDKWGEPIPDQAGPAKWSTPLVDPRNQANADRPADPRYTKPNNDVQR